VSTDASLSSGAPSAERRHYLDHASTSPLRPEAAEAMIRWLRQPHGDPGRIHAEGIAARVAIEDAREQVAARFGARGREVVFTSSATEAIAAATWGAAERGRRMLLSAVEHSAVREASAMFAGVSGGDVVEVGVDAVGRIDADAVADAIDDDTALVHVQWGNHEVGTVQPVEAVVAACRSRGALVHVDAAQANGHATIDFRSLDADLVSLSAHKFGGPPGIGALLVRRGLRLRPLLVGGDQERARRAGLENVPAIVGFGAACDALGGTRLADEIRDARRRTDAMADAATAIEGVVAYGDPIERLPHLVCLGIADIEPQAVLLGLDRVGIAAHSGSACSSESLEPSPVLEAMGVDAHRSLRVSVGWNTTDEDVDAFVTSLPRVVAGLRELGR
jgi:cysteine desulfurase